MQGELIKLRKQHHLTQAEAAKMLGIHPDTYARKERGLQQFTSNEMFVLKDHFQLPMDIIFCPLTSRNATK